MKKRSFHRRPLHGSGSSVGDGEDSSSDAVNDRYMHMALREELLDEVLRKRALLRAARMTPLTFKEFARRNKISRSSLYRLLNNAAAGTTLDRRHDNRGRPTRVPLCALGWAFKFVHAFPGTPLTVVYNDLRCVADKECWGKFSYDAFRRQFNSYPEDVRVYLREGQEAFFDKTCLKVRRSTGCINGLWQMDATLLKVWVYDAETNEIFRPWMITVIDARSRTIPGLVFTKGDPTARDVLILLRDSIMPKEERLGPFYGLPAAIQSDNHQVFQCEEVKDVMVRLGIDFDPIDPNCPEANGKQERLFRRVKDQFCARLISFSQKPNALRKASKLVITWPMLLRLAAKFFLEYHSTDQRELKTSPWEFFFEENDTAHGMFFDAVEVLDAIRVRETKTVEQDGVLLEKQRYSAAELTGLVGTEIEVRFDPEGPGLRVPAYLRGKYLCDLRSFLADEALGEEIQAARSGRTCVLKDWAASMTKMQAHLPPIETNAAPIVRRGKPKKSKGKGQPAQNENDGDNSEDEKAPPSVPKLGTEEI